MDHNARHANNDFSKNDAFFVNYSFSITPDVSIEGSPWFRNVFRRGFNSCFPRPISKLFSSGVTSLWVCRPVSFLAQFVHYHNRPPN